MQQVEQLLVSIPEVAAMLGISPWTVRRTHPPGDPAGRLHRTEGVGGGWESGKVYSTEQKGESVA